MCCLPTMKSKSTTDGEHQRDAAGQGNRDNMNRFPALVGEVDALRHGLHQRPFPVRLQSEEKGASFLAIGYSDQTEIPNQFECSDQTEVPSEKKTGYSGQIEKPAQFECSDQTGESSEKDGVFSFHTAG